MRAFRIEDLLWLEKFVKEQGEWENLLRALSLGVSAWVIEGEAIGVVWLDQHGYVIGGLTNLPHIKSAVAIAKSLVDAAIKMGVNLHTHDKEGTLGRKLFYRLGFIQDGDALWLSVPVKEKEI